MSSPKSAAAKTVQRPKLPVRPNAKSAPDKPAPNKSAKPSVKPAARSAAKLPASAASDQASGQAKRLAAEIERGLANGTADLAPEALQALMSIVCKSYARRVEAGEPLLPLGQRSTVSPTEVMVTASGLLRAANLAVFELGMWQSWTGR